MIFSDGTQQCGLKTLHKSQRPSQFIHVWRSPESASRGYENEQCALGGYQSVLLGEGDVETSGLHVLEQMLRTTASGFSRFASHSVGRLSRRF